MGDMIDISDLTPTIGCSEVAELKDCATSLVREKAHLVAGAYKNSTGWQIPREEINNPPLSDLPRKRGRKPRQS